MKQTGQPPDTLWRTTPPVQRQDTPDYRICCLLPPLSPPYVHAKRITCRSAYRWCANGGEKSNAVGKNSVGEREKTSVVGNWTPPVRVDNPLSTSLDPCLSVAFVSHILPFLSLLLSHLYPRTPPCPGGHPHLSRWTGYGHPRVQNRR